jgi:hypothetical protein
MGLEGWIGLIGIDGVLYRYMSLEQVYGMLVHCRSVSTPYRSIRNSNLPKRRHHRFPLSEKVFTQLIQSLQTAIQEVLVDWPMH